jgi:hypothetical protein
VARRVPAGLVPVAVAPIVVAPAAVVVAPAVSITVLFARAGAPLVAAPGLLLVAVTFSLSTPAMFGNKVFEVAAAPWRPTAVVQGLHLSELFADCLPAHVLLPCQMLRLPNFGVGVGHVIAANVAHLHNLFLAGELRVLQDLFLLLDLLHRGHLFHALIHLPRLAESVGLLLKRLDLRRQLIHLRLRGGRESDLLILLAGELVARTLDLQVKLFHEAAEILAELVVEAPLVALLLRQRVPLRLRLCIKLLRETARLARSRGARRQTQPYLPTDSSSTYSHGPRSEREFLNRICGEQPHNQCLSISSS